ncbi:MAG: L,D-transpeptidase family protein [Bacteriovoracaceae bacterium]|nr:L,D-transpeptidase family protein [Bacteriovoracaceae bacterium]
MSKTVLFVISILLSAFQLEASEFYPENLIQMDDYFTHHVLVAEKSTHKLYMFKNKDGVPELVKTYQMATGKKAGDKIFQGDHRTPEGVFQFTNFLTHEDLLKRHGKQGEIYGVGAFVMNYPNPMDSRSGKTGGGIWLHSTNDETRIDKGLDSRGCIVSANEDLIDISKYIELDRTKVVVVHELNWLNKETYLLRKKEILSGLEAWRAAWSDESIKPYIEAYHPKEFKDGRHGSISTFRTYKKNVFWGPGKPEVNISNISILKGAGYLLISFLQDYKSQTIEDVGVKHLYLKRDEYYKWRIVYEGWTKQGISEEGDTRVAFKPSLRFFKSGQPDQIMTVPINKKENN